MATKGMNQTGFARFLANLIANFAKKTDLPTKVSELSNDSGFLTEVPNHSASKITSGKIGESRLPTIPTDNVEETMAIGEANTYYYLRSMLHTGVPDTDTRRYSVSKYTAAEATAKFKEMVFTPVGWADPQRVIRIPATGTMTVSQASSVADIASASDSRITKFHEVIHSVIGAPANQTSDWTVTTSNGALTVNGTCSAQTTLVLYLERCD